MIWAVGVATFLLGLCVGYYGSHTEEDRDQARMVRALYDARFKPTRDKAGRYQSRSVADASPSSAD